VSTSWLVLSWEATEYSTGMLSMVSDKSRVGQHGNSISAYKEKEQVGCESGVDAIIPDLEAFPL
jgi:hypothetical protein